MIEPISAVISKAGEVAAVAAKEAALSGKEVTAESYKESAETAIKESPVKSVLSETENLNYETLKAQNEEYLKINEIKPSQIYLNRENGDLREDIALKEIKKEFPESEGYKHHTECYLRDAEGNLVKDPITGEARRVDIMVEKDGKIYKSYEITSETAPKASQSAKEMRIREAGGNFIKKEGRSIEIPIDVQTEIRRLK